MLDMPKIIFEYSNLDWPACCPLTDDVPIYVWRSYEFVNKHSQQKFKVRLKKVNGGGAVTQMDVLA